MSSTHTGEILEIGEIKSISEKFQKRRFVVDEVYVGGKYGPSHNPVPFFLTQEKCALIDQFQVGQHVVVHYDINSRPWIKDGVHQRDKDDELAYFVEVRAWKIEAAVAENATPQDQSAPVQGQAPPSAGAAGQGDPSGGFDDNGPDDLPF
jgi:hypothetical protein